LSIVCINLKEGPNASWIESAAGECISGTAIWLRNKWQGISGTATWLRNKWQDVYDGFTRFFEGKERNGNKNQENLPEDGTEIEITGGGSTSA
jgi:hypothetical protein